MIREKARLFPAKNPPVPGEGDLAVLARGTRGVLNTFYMKLSIHKEGKAMKASAKKVPCLVLALLLTGTSFSHTLENAGNAVRVKLILLNGRQAPVCAPYVGQRP